MPFIERFPTMPSASELTAIEGIKIIDAPPPAPLSGVGQGVAGVVGEFADCTYAVTMSTAGVFSTKLRPQRVTSAQDLLDKFGGWDELLGEFGGDCGNGFVELQGNKPFPGLVVCPVNLTSARGVRVWRDLPTNVSATAPSPVVPMQAGLVTAGREFRVGSNRFRIATRALFSALPAYVSGIDGDVANVGTPAATMLFSTVAGVDFVAAGVAVGDILVLGVIDAAGAQGANAGTYRIAAVAPGSVVSDLTIEKMDGSTFDWTTSSAMAWRVHPGSAADTGGAVALSGAGGYNVPVRCIDASAAQSADMTPTLAPSAATATTWDTLSGLGAKATNDAGGIVRIAETQAANPATNATLRTAYTAALTALTSDNDPANQINHLWCARCDTTIAAQTKLWAQTASVYGLGRMVCISPPLDAVDTASEAAASAYPGAGGNRSDRVIYSWPPARIYVPQAVGQSIALADGSSTTDGVLDVQAASFDAAVLGVVPYFTNPAIEQAPATTAIAGIVGLATNVPALTRDDYVTLRQYGVMGLRQDPVNGFVFQSGVTTSLVAGQKNVARRRTADYVQDSLARLLSRYSKLPLTQGLKDDIVSDCVGFLEVLKSPTNRPAATIEDYLIDAESGNTPATLAQGIFVVIVKVRTLASADFITLQVEAGESVVINTVA